MPTRRRRRIRRSGRRPPSAPSTGRRRRVARVRAAPAAISPAAADTSRIRPSRSSSMPVILVSRLTSRTPSPPLRSSGTGVAPSVSSTRSTSRSRSITAPAATASTSATVVVDTAGSGWVSSKRSGHLAAQHLADQPRQDHRFGVDLAQQTGGQQPLHRPVRRRARRRVAGSSHRRALQQPLQQIGAARRRARRAVRRSRRGVLGPFHDGLAGIPGQAGRSLGGHAHRRVAPHQRAFTKVVDRGGDGVLRWPGHRSAPAAWSAGRRRCRRAAPAARRAPPAAGSRAHRSPP